MNRRESPGNRPLDRLGWGDMFEHMRNYELLLARVASWMKPQATLFVHIFTHREYACPFGEVRDESDWMSRYFFTGGIMPSDDLLLYFQRDVRLAGHWQVSGRHRPARERGVACEHGRQRGRMPILAGTRGADQAIRWWVYRRVFFMSCAELCGFRGGRAWLVSHYPFEKR